MLKGRPEILKLHMLEESFTAWSPPRIAHPSTHPSFANTKSPANYQAFDAQSILTLTVPPPSSCRRRCPSRPRPATCQRAARRAWRRRLQLRGTQSCVHILHQTQMNANRKSKCLLPLTSPPRFPARGRRPSTPSYTGALQSCWGA